MKIAWDEFFLRFKLYTAVPNNARGWFRSSKVKFEHFFFGFYTVALAVVRFKLLILPNFPTGSRSETFWNEKLFYSLAMPILQVCLKCPKMRKYHVLQKFPQNIFRILQYISGRLSILLDMYLFAFATVYINLMFVVFYVHF